MKKIAMLLVATLTLLALVGCNSGFPVTVQEDIEIAQKPEKVASVSPSLTEIIFDMGLEQRLVAISSYCQFTEKETDAGAEELPAIGSAQGLDIEKIRELAPNILLTNTPLLESELIELQQMDVQVIQFRRAETLDELWELYSDVAKVFEGEEKGPTLATETYANLKAQLEATKTAVESLSTVTGALYVRQLGEVLVATGDTLEGQMMTYLGINNLAANYLNWSYPPMELTDEEDATGTSGTEEEEPDAAYLADIIFYSSHVDVEALKEAFAGTLAVENENLVQVDEIALERQGARMLEELIKMAKAAYPGANIAAPEGEGSQN